MHLRWATRGLEGERRNFSPGTFGWRGWTFQIIACHPLGHPNDQVLHVQGATSSHKGCFKNDLDSGIVDIWVAIDDSEYDPAASCGRQDTMRLNRVGPVKRYTCVLKAYASDLTSWGDWLMVWHKMTEPRENYFVKPFHLTIVLGMVCIPLQILYCRYPQTAAKNFVMNWVPG